MSVNEKKNELHEVDLCHTVARRKSEMCEVEQGSDLFNLANVIQPMSSPRISNRILTAKTFFWQTCWLQRG